MESNEIDVQMRIMDDLMARLQRVMHVQSVISDCGLTASQVFILRFLDKQAQAKASDIARVAGLSPGAVTQVCDELVRLGFVDRTRSVDDRRVVHVALTTDGKAKLEQVRIAHSARLRTILVQLGTEDTESFVRIMGRLVELVEAQVREKAD